MEYHPDSVPINALVAVEGTPLGGLWIDSELLLGLGSGCSILLLDFSVFLL
jgi:hypothetical protein